MQTVSTNWKQTMGCYSYTSRPNIVPESQVEIRYTISDPDAQNDVVASDNGHASYSDVTETTSIADKTFLDIATLELNSWGLSGSKEIIPDAITDEVGFISYSLSASDCTFTANPIITLTFSSVFATTIPGITITWSESYGQWARDFIVRIYNGVTLLNTINVSDNEDILSVVMEDIADYDKIEIEVVEWNLPYTRVRVEEIIVGVVQTYTKADITGYQHTASADLLSLELPKNEIVFDIDNSDDTWNPDNPTGLTQYLIAQQKVVVRYGYKINGAVEWIKGGTFYMSDWNTPSNGITATFTASSLINFMTAKYTLPDPLMLTLSALAEDALTQADLPTNDDGSNKWSIDGSLADITVTLTADFDYTLAEVLQLCANAACCVLYCDRNGDIVIEPLTTTLTDYLVDEFVSYKNADYKLSEELKSVDVNSGTGTASNSSTGKIQNIENTLIQNGTVAGNVATWVKDVLKYRKTLSGEYRPDPRLDPLDKITTTNKFASNSVYITGITLTYGGAFQGKYEGRVSA